jgi:hypothetical protein
VFPGAYCLSEGQSGAKPEWSGTLDVGTARYEVTLDVVQCPTGGLSLATINLLTQGQPLASAASTSGLLLPSGNVCTSMPPCSLMLPVSTNNMALTETAIKVYGYTRLLENSSMRGAWWESSGTLKLMDDLPVKARIFFEACGGEGKPETYRASKIVVYSLGEWNNRLNDNLVLRLEQKGEKGK